MKTTNISAKAFFPASAVVGGLASFVKRLEGETDEALKEREVAARKRMVEVSAMEAGDEKEKAVAELESDLPAEYRNQLTAVGVRLPSDRVEVTVTLGTFFFDLYAMSAKAPAAPLAQAVHQRKLQDLATKLDKDEFELSTEEVSIIKPALENEKLWDSVQISCSVPVGEEKRFISLNSKAAPYFAPVLNAAVTYLMGYGKAS